MTSDPATADAAAKRQGLNTIERIRALRGELGLSLAAARAVVDATDGGPPHRSEIASREALLAELTSELGYCACASEVALGVLSGLLRTVQARTDATADSQSFAQASRRLEALLEGGGGWAEWLVYGLDQKGLVWHGFRQADLWITDKGRRLLRGVEQFGSGSPEE